MFIIGADMVKNKGFLPSGPSEIAIQRKQIKDIIFSLLPACKDPDPDTGIPFKVDAIIANPPAYGQYSCSILKRFLHFALFFSWLLKSNSFIITVTNTFFKKIQGGGPRCCNQH
jgi:sterol 3beta-glucosyltransferase